ncbi:AFG1-like ATPase-domain-containing protein [Schizophyllum commune]
MPVVARLRQVYCYAQASSVFPLQRRWKTYAIARDTGVGLPANSDLLDRYKGLVALGHIKQDEEQLRVVMQLRRLSKELEGYSPPAISAALLQRSSYSATKSSSKDDTESESETMPWWKHSDDEGHISERAVATRKSHAEELAALTTPKGLLLIGTPGSGKSFLVDLWLDTLSTPYKSRKHYSLLVLEIYRGVWEETQRRMLERHHEPDAAPAPPETWNKTIREHWRRLTRAGAAPIRWASGARGSQAFSWYSATSESIAYTVAQRLVLRHWLLVLDELQLLDVSSATLLADVLSWYWRMGGVIVGTSNRVPDDLYRNGVQRDRLEPFVEALKIRCPVVEMRSDTDWREVIAHEGGDRSSWYTTEERSEFDLAMKQDNFGAVGTSADAHHITVFGRQIPTLRAGNGVAMFTFAELCHEALGPADYISIAAKFSTIYITDLPVLRISDKNQARRFITLIDALYEARCRIVVLAEAPPHQLFFPEAGTAEQPDVDVMMAESVAETRDTYRPNVASYDGPNMEEAPEQVKTNTPLDQLSIFSGQDEQFAFKRALSRLMEMTSPAYASRRKWVPVSDRQWETSSVASHPMPSSATRRQARPSPLAGSSEAANSDFAQEAAHESTTFTGRRPPAPRIANKHVWGVDDLGQSGSNSKEASDSKESVERRKP